MRKHKADLGISLDGDADRIIMCDENGSIIDGDQIIAALAIFWKKKRILKGGVVGTLMSNYGLEKFFNTKGIKFIRANVGDRYVKEIMKRNNIELEYNLKVIMDFEEEISSPNLADAVKKYSSKLKSDALLIFDGPKHPSNLPTLTFGARGISDITLITYGPIVPQHSGHFGNYAPNPVFRMSEILSSMKDPSGRVIIPGFYDGIELDKKTLKILDEVPDDEEKMMNDMQFKEPDNVGKNYQESIQYPSINVRGIESGWVREEVRTIVPSECIAEIDVRLVLESDPIRLHNLIKSHIQELGYYVIDRRPTKDERLKHDKIVTFVSSFDYDAFRTDIESEIGKWLVKSLKKTFGIEPVKKRTSGGSVPISPFVNTLGIPAVTVPTVNQDNNQHSPNENIKIENYITKKPFSVDISDRVEDVTKLVKKYNLGQFVVLDQAKVLGILDVKDIV